MKQKKVVEGGETMLTVTKEFTFDCAHMLSGHNGLCKNIHGHTYKLQVEVTSLVNTIPSGPSMGMVVDFKDLKAIVKELIVDDFDHACVVWEEGNPTEQDLRGFLLNHGLKSKVVDYRPTAENMARSFYDLLDVGIKTRCLGVRINSVRLWETPTSHAEVTR